MILSRNTQEYILSLRLTEWYFDIDLYLHNAISIHLPGLYRNTQNLHQLGAIL